MFYDDDLAIEQNNGIVISAYNELLNERVAGDEFCWGYYLRTSKEFELLDEPAHPCG